MCSGFRGCGSGIARLGQLCHPGGQALWVQVRKSCALTKATVDLPEARLPYRQAAGAESPEATRNLMRLASPAPLPDWWPAAWLIASR